jgi:hypothetical protein
MGVLIKGLRGPSGEFGALGVVEVNSSAVDVFRFVGAARRRARFRSACAVPICSVIRDSLRQQPRGRPTARGSSVAATPPPRRGVHTFPPAHAPPSSRPTQPTWSSSPHGTMA